MSDSAMTAIEAMALNIDESGGAEWKALVTRCGERFNAKEQRSKVSQRTFL